MTTATTTRDSLDARLDEIHAQMAWLVERQRKQEELLAALTPIAREALAVVTTRLDGLEKRGWFSSLRELGKVGERVLDHYGPDDVRALGDAIITILDTVRALTRPDVLSLIGEASDALAHGEEAPPVGLMGVARASRDPEVRKGLAVLVEVLRHVGRAAGKVAPSAIPAATERPADRKERLAAVLGPKRARALPAHPREAAPAPPPATRIAPPATATAAATCSTSREPAPILDGEWSHEVAEGVAAAEGITLSPAHWQVIDAARAEWEAKHAAANVRRLTQLTGLATKDLFALFPKAPGRTVAHIAGTPKPAGCI